jgi:CRP-like cAMP-binding protein
MENLFLSSLSPVDHEKLRAVLKPIHLVQQTVLFEMAETVPQIYFPEGAIISLVLPLSSGELIEAAMVGKDGIVGASSALDGKIAMNRAIVQMSGHSLVCSSDVFKQIVLASPGLLSRVIRHEQTLYAQAQQSAACMAAHHVEARLCRWLLRSRDLAESDNLPFTQEFLGEMLGVRRTSVSLVAHTLQQAGMIQYRRGKIQILDVDGLQQSACECYETVKMQYSVLLGPRNY